MNRIDLVYKERCPAGYAVLRGSGRDLSLKNKFFQKE